MKVSQLKPGQVTGYSRDSLYLITSSARHYPKRALSNEKVWDVYGVDQVPLRWERRGKSIDTRPSYLKNTAPHSVQCENTLGTDEVSPWMTVYENGVLVNGPDLGLSPEVLQAQCRLRMP